jgi:putative transcriptional regulator
MHSLKGHFLVASPHLADPNFARTVVLLVQHGKEGAFGVVLNRPAENTLQEVWEKVAGSACEIDAHVYMGGPVPGPLLAVHGDQSLAEMEIAPGVYFASQRDHLERLVHQPEFPSRFFVWHSGWGGGQLERELEEGAWLTAPATADCVFSDGSELWNRVTREIGSSLLNEILGTRNLPKDPTVN